MIYVLYSCGFWNFRPISLARAAHFQLTPPTDDLSRNTGHQKKEERVQSKKPWYSVLYVQVLIGIALGVLATILGIPLMPTDMNQYDPTLNAVSFVAGWLYFALMESSARGATLGKMALGLRVVTSDGQRLSFLHATGRYFAKILSAIILFIGFIMIAFTERKRGLHDMIAGTLVIKVR